MIRIFRTTVNITMYFVKFLSSSLEFSFRFDNSLFETSVGGGKMVSGIDFLSGERSGAVMLDIGS